MLCCRASWCWLTCRCRAPHGRTTRWVAAGAGGGGCWQDPVARMLQPKLAAIEGDSAADQRTCSPEPPLLQHNELAIAELQLNGFSRAEAVSALEANGGDAEASLAWLLERQLAAEGQQDQVAVAELTAYGLSKADAEAALKECSGDVDQVCPLGSGLWLPLPQARPMHACLPCMHG